MRVVLLDPSSENVNAGDEVIFEAIARQGLTGVDSARRLTTHRTLNWSERRAVSQADAALCAEPTSSARTWSATASG